MEMSKAAGYLNNSLVYNVIDLFDSHINVDVYIQHLVLSSVYTIHKLKHCFLHSIVKMNPK